MHTFRHAVSLDERRAKFKANLWNLPNTKEAKLGSEARSTANPTASKAASRAPASALRAAAGVPAPGPAVHQSIASLDDDPDHLYDAKELLRKGFAPASILPVDILPPALRSSANEDHGADVEGGDTSNEKSDKDSKILNNLLNGHTKSQKGRKKEDSGDRKLNTFERIYSEKDRWTTDVEEVWFAVRGNSFFSFLKLKVDFYSFDIFIGMSLRYVCLLYFRFFVFSHLKSTLTPIIDRHRRRLRIQQNTPLPRTHPAPLDGPRMLQS